MKKRVILSTLLISSFAASGIALGDSDEHGGMFGRWFGSAKTGVAPVDNARYRSECASCHFAYQPGLLPARSWKKLMAGLEDHFGDNAELDPADHKQILDYLVNNAADNSEHYRSRRIAGSIRENEAPLRITDTLYFQRKHHEIPDRFVTDNKEVGSFSNCSACHTRADSGSFNEHQVRIPGVGHWDD